VSPSGMNHPRRALLDLAYQPATDLRYIRSGDGLVAVPSHQPTEAIEVRE
jgi:hypothetical protein